MMRNKIIHRSKIPDLILIDANRIDIFLEYSDDGKIQSFSIDKLDLDGLNLPENASIELICETRDEELYFPLGTIFNKQLIKRDLSKYDLNSLPLFRIIVFIHGNPKLLASSDNFRAITKNGDLPCTSLLPVIVSENLEERLWKLEIKDEGPQLLINSNEVGMKQLLEDQILIKGLILPEIVSQILKYIIKKDDDTRDWINNWKIFASKYGVEDFAQIDPNDDNEIEDTVDRIVKAWCQDISLCEEIINEKENNHL